MSGLTTHHARILEDRGLDVELLANLGVRSWSRNGGGDWVAIPYLRGGQVVNHKYRTIGGPKEFMQDKDAVKCLWNEDVLQDGTLANAPVVITEGEFDAVIAMQAGFARVVSVPDGAPKQELGDAAGAKYDFLDAALPLLEDARDIVLAVDGDGPGSALRMDLARRLRASRCRYVRYPDGCKDLNDVWLKAGGAAAVRAAVNNAAWCEVRGLYRMSELPPLPNEQPLPLEVPVMDRHIRIRRGDFSVLTGLPGHGKSSLINDIAGRLALNHKVRTAFFSPEQRTQVDHRRNLRWWYLRKPPSTWVREEWEEADAWIDQNFVFLVPGDDDATLPWFFNVATAAVDRFGVSIVVLDPWNELEHDRGYLSLTEYVGQAIRSLRRFAARFRVHLLVAAHPTKLPRGRDGRHVEPTLSDISDSAHWYNKADIGMVLKSSQHKGVTTLSIDKIRYHTVNGERGEVPLEWVPYEGRFRVREDLLPGSMPIDDR